MESNDSPEIPDREETSDIPGLPSGAQGTVGDSRAMTLDDVLYSTHRSRTNVTQGAVGDSRVTTLDDVSYSAHRTRTNITQGAVGDSRAMTLEDVLYATFR